MLPLGLVLTASSAVANTSTQARTDYASCVSTESAKIANAPASATEVALAAIHRCNSARNDFWFYELERFGKSPTARKHADESLAKEDERLTRMAVSEVIEARVKSRGEN